MAKSDSLHELVASLDNREAQFVIALAKSRRKEPKNVLDLFDAMRNPEVTEKSSLHTKIKGINVIRFHLKQLILQSLRILEEQENVQRQINTHLHNESIFYRRGIYDEAAKELVKAKELAEKHDETGLVIRILVLIQHRTLESATRELVKDIDENGSWLISKAKAYRSEILTIVDYQRTFARYRIQSEGESLIEIKPLEKPAMVPTFSQKLYSLLKDSVVARSKGNFQEAGEILGKAVEEFEARPELIESQTNRYKILLSNQATFLIPSAEYKRAEIILEKMISIPDGDFNGKAETFQSYAHLNLLLLINTLDFSRFKNLENQVLKGLEDYKEKINPARQFAIWYNLMVAYLINEDFPNALRWLDRILLHKRFEVRREIQYATRVIELVLHYEHNNYLGIDSKIVALRRYLIRKEEESAFRSAVLSSFQELINARNESEMHAIFHQLQNHVHDIGEKPDLLERLGMRVIQGWAMSRANGTTLIQTLKTLR